ncbi:MAG: branched-chain amino acid ABC transporter permease [Proteobacteria bacterium]|nr:branched-chain amino acid ABC transporter permease [Pseudomonadota bacterium]
MRKKPRNWIYWIVLLAVLLLIPRVFGIVQTNTFVEFYIWAMYAVTINLLLSFTGLLSFGHALFFGTGAYATALALTHIDGFPLIPSVLVGGLAAALVALICCPLLVRVSGTAFAMLTLAFGQLMYVVCLKFREITGGEDGLAGFPVPPFRIPGILSIDMANPKNFYFFAVVVLGISLWFLWFLTKTPFGSLMVGIRDNAMRVDYMGFKLPQTKAIIFIVSGGFAGIAGAVYALFQNVVSTDGVLHILVSFTPIMAILVGGLGTFFGPILGQGILLLVEELSMRFTEYSVLVSGLLFVLVVLFAPSGAAGLFITAKTKWFSREDAS